MTRMRVDEESIRHVATVARLNLTDEEIELFLPQMKDIIEAMDKVQEVDTEGVEPSFQPIVLADKLREDRAEECLTQEEALANAPQQADGYFKGPKAV